MKPVQLCTSFIFYTLPAILTPKRNCHMEYTQLNVLICYQISLKSFGKWISIQTSSFAGYGSTGVYLMHLHIFHKDQNLVHGPIGVATSWWR